MPRSSLIARRSSLQPVRFTFQTPPTTGRRPAIFLDRDGVINERIMHGYVTNWHEFQLIKDAEGVLRELARLRLPILVISNQSGVGKGLLSRRVLQEVTRRFVAALGRRGARIDGVYYCPHRPDEGCPCRKPKPGMLLQAAVDWRIDLAGSVMVGDTASDVEAAQAAGCRSILLARPEAPGRGAFGLKPSEGPAIHSLSELPGCAAARLGRSSLKPSL